MITSTAQLAAVRDRISPAKLAHVVLRSGDKQKLIDWYVMVLDATIAFDSPFLTFLAYDDEHHRIAFAQVPELKPAGAGSPLDHVSFTYGTPDDLFATYERLKAAGITPFWTVNHGPTLSFFYRDPDGNHCELQIDIFEDTAAIEAWFKDSDFPTNPIGVRFVPEEIIARYRAGEPAASLFARPVIDSSLVFAQLPPGAGIAPETDA